MDGRSLLCESANKVVINKCTGTDVINKPKIASPTNVLCLLQLWMRRNRLRVQHMDVSVLLSTIISDPIVTTDNRLTLRRRKEVRRSNTCSRIHLDESSSETIGSSSDGS
ncbi:unnamed protein product [Thelazia callipaeda]|uniref:Uncharacterized protein n=1 Tax=Thelazia callipaeda TaxID=103827 RepID=A0A0N5CXJ2_THECL|nr:unnamed protein product [Thelazia callipaeda]